MFLCWNLDYWKESCCLTDKDNIKVSSSLSIFYSMIAKTTGYSLIETQRVDITSAQKEIPCQFLLKGPCYMYPSRIMNSFRRIQTGGNQI